jgi:hypothetical protein
VLGCGIFLLWLLVLGIFFQASVHALAETRRTALVTALIGRNSDALSTATILSTLETVGSLESVNLDDELSLIMSEEKVTTNNQTIWNWPWHMGTGSNASYYNELYTPYLITSVLKQRDAIDRANRTALISLVMERYNETQGAFHELAYMDAFDGKEYTDCFLPLDGDARSHLWLHGGYGTPNVISTFLAVSILDNIQALDQINTTKTLQWILECEAQNGAFRPFPWPGDSLYYRNKGFWVDDQYGTGIVYTYSALSSLIILNASISNVVNIGRIREYVTSCNVTHGSRGIRFAPYYSEHKHDSGFCNTYYAVTILHNMGVLENETEIVSGVITYIKSAQDLHCTEAWPMPTRNNEGYGLFCYSWRPYTENLYVAEILKETNNTHLLDEATPIVRPARRNLIVMTSAASLGTLMLISLTAKTCNSVRAWKRNRKDSRST